MVEKRRSTRGLAEVCTTPIAWLLRLGYGEFRVKMTHLLKNTYIRCSSFLKLMFKKASLVPRRHHVIKQFFFFFIILVEASVVN